MSVFLFLTLYLYAVSIPFNEEKYINALQSSVYNKGFLEITDDFIKISYPKKDKTYLFYADHIVHISNNNEETIKYEDNLELTIFSKLIHAIYNNKSEELKEYFEINANATTIVLLPNEYLSNAIKKIEYQKNGTVLKFLKIYFNNEDWIKIEETR